MTKLGIVSDDVTGGTTVGALLAREGVTPTLFFDTQAIVNTVGADEDIVIVSTDSRAMKPGQAYMAVKKATQRLEALGVVQYAKRIDTTLRGGIGPEVEGMLDALGEEHVALVVPAMPQSRKIVVGGYSLINSVLLAQTPVSRDVRTPVLDSDIRQLLQNQFSQKVAYVPLEDVIQGVDVIAGELTLQRSKGSRVFLVDSTTLEDIDAVADAVVKLGWKTVAVDPGPFTVSLALREHAIRPGRHPDRAIRSDSSPEDRGTVVVVAGSATDTTREQMMRLAREEGTVSLGVDPMKLICRDGSLVQSEINRVLSQAREICIDARRRPRVLVLAVDIALSRKKAATKNELSAVSGLDPDKASDLITSRFSSLARKVADVVGRDRCAGFYLTGGDTMVKFCRAIDAQGMRLVDYLIPQVDQSIIVGGPYAGTPVICKGGLTGTDITTVQAVNRLFDEHHVKANNKEKVSS